MELQSRESRLVHVAELYYEQGMSQQKIAGLLGLSRPTVSRLLEEARACGVVEIVVHAPLRKQAELSARLRRELGLRDAVVVVTAATGTGRSTGAPKRRRRPFWPCWRAA